MKILAIEKEIPGANAAQFLPHLKAEAAAVWELYRSGVIREAYFDDKRHAAVLMLECADAGKARTVLSTLPLVKERLIDFDIIPLVPYTGFDRLFEGSR
jgi:hypothetical protein